MVRLCTLPMTAMALISSLRFRSAIVSTILVISSQRNIKYAQSLKIVSIKARDSQLSFNISRRREKLRHDDVNSSRPQLDRRGGDLHRSNVRKIVFASIMSFLAGCSNIVCLRRFYCYVFMMTGNIIKMTIAITEGEWMEAVWISSLVVSYLFGASISRFMDRMCQANENSNSRFNRDHLKSMAPMISVLFVLYDVLARETRWGVPILAMTYGIVYSGVSQAMDSTTTQLMHGHLIKLGSGVSDVCLGRFPRWENGSLMSLCIIGSFIAGIMFGAHVSKSSIGIEGPFFSILGLLYAIAFEWY